MGLNYYKEIDKVAIDGGNYSAVTTPGEMKRRGVGKERSVEVGNHITKVNLLNFHERSGAVEYGLYVNVACTFASGEEINIEVDGMDYLRWVQAHSIVNGEMDGDFVILFTGTTVRLVVYRSSAHEEYLSAYIEQERKKEESKNLEIAIGDVVDIHYAVVYIGEYYFYKPSLKKGSVTNKLRKYKLYISAKEENGWDITNGHLYVESGRTKQNQPTKILGHVDVNIGELIAEAKNRMKKMSNLGVGYEKSGHYVQWRARTGANQRAYTLANIGKAKEDVIYPDTDELLKYAWLCGWDYNRKDYKQVENRRGGEIPYYLERNLGNG